MTKTVEDFKPKVKKIEASDEGEIEVGEIVVVPSDEEKPKLLAELSKKDTEIESKDKKSTLSVVPQLNKNQSNRHDQGRPTRNDGRDKREDVKQQM